MIETFPLATSCVKEAVSKFVARKSLGKCFVGKDPSKLASNDEVSRPGDTSLACEKKELKQSRGKINLSERPHYSPTASIASNNRGLYFFDWQSVIVVLSG